MAINDIDISRVAQIGATLGEGPVWDSASALLWFVDIKKPRLYRYNEATKKLDHWDAPAEIGWALPSDDGRLLCGLQDGLYWFDPAQGTFSFRCHVEPDDPDNRLNDATTDPSGRIWFGSMDNGEAKNSGRFYKLDRDTPVPAGPDKISITNGPAVSPDGKTIYFTDTLGRKILKAAIDASGNVGATELFHAFAEGTGYPDGPVCDSQGNVWSCMYAGWGAICFDPAGKQIDFIRLPVANVTKLAFGGADLKTAYFTTAAQGLSAEERTAQPFAGDLFSCRMKIAGVRATPFRTS